MSRRFEAVPIADLGQAGVGVGQQGVESAVQPASLNKGRDSAVRFEQAVGRASADAEAADELCRRQIGIRQAGVDLATGLGENESGEGAFGHRPGMGPDHARRQHADRARSGMRLF